jgi:replicative DNA helicase
MTILANSEIEQALLGAVLCDHRVLNAVSFLTADDFAFANHQMIWLAIEAVRGKGEVVNPPSVCRLLADRIGEIGGADYVAQLAAAPLGTLPAPHWAKELRDLAAKRRLKAVVQDTSEKLEGDSEVTAEEIAADLILEAESVSAKAAPRVHTTKDIRIREAEGLGRHLPCYPTGFDCLDRAMGGGLYQKRTYCIAARKKQGKTMLAGGISDHLNRSGIRHLFIACEMGSDQIEHRTMAKHLSVNALAFLDPRYRNAAWFQQKVAQFAITAPDNLSYLDAPGLTFDQLRRELTHAILAHDVKGVVLDYLQLVGGQRKGQSKAEHLDEISQWIAETCKKHGIFALVLAQINQEGNVRGGEGIRLAFDQVYELKKQEAGDGAWLEMLDTRYTKWMELGSETQPTLWLETRTGPYFREVGPVAEPEAA